MKPAARWPLHPAPLEGEALSSWVRRIAECYDLSVPDLLDCGLGPGSAAVLQLDLNPTSAVIGLLARRTGVEPERLNRMSLAGWTPWLLDTIEPDATAFETYVHQFSVLLPPGKRPRRTVPGWLAWIPARPLQRACPQCLADPRRQGLLLIWQLPLLLSCPEHGCLLETCMGFPGLYLEWTSGYTSPRPASERIRAMDHRTHQALTTGHVRLPRRSVHAAIWFRLLRTLVDELSIPISRLGSHASDLRLIWEKSGYPLRAGQSKWCPFERSPWPVQARLLEATAYAIGLLEVGAVTGPGARAGLFRPEPYREVESGNPPSNNSTGKAVCPMTLRQAMDEAVQAAREDAAAAQTLYDFCLIGCRTRSPSSGCRPTSPSSASPSAACHK